MVYSLPDWLWLTLGVIHRLISEKKVTWGMKLIQALKANWKGSDNLRQLCINSGYPKYGNDDDDADQWASLGHGNNLR